MSPTAKPTATDLKTLEAVPGIVIQQALDAQRAEIYEQMSDKLDDLKDSVSKEIRELALEMRKGFGSINRELGEAKTERRVLQNQMKQVDTTTKANHAKSSIIVELLDKVTDPKRAVVLVAVVTTSAGWIRNRGSHLLPWFALHPNVSALAQVFLAMMLVIGVYYVLRAIPAKPAEPLPIVESTEECVEGENDGFHL